MSRSRSQSVRLFAPSFFLALIAWGVALCYYYHLRNLFPFDDTYITFRYAYNLAHGYGLVWNPGGAHTEGYTNFLFVLLLAPISLITKELVPFAQWISILTNLVTGFTLYRFGALLTVPRDPRKEQRKGPIHFAGTAAMLLFFAEPYTWYNAFSGMETSLFVMLVVLTFYQLVQTLRTAEPSQTILSIRRTFVLSFITLLTRPEGALLCLIAVTVFLIRFSRLRRAIFREALIDLVVPLAVYALFKYFYFGDLFPNSFYVKVALRESFAANDAMGSHFLPAFYAGIRYLLLLAVIGMIFLRHRPLVLLACIIWIAGLTLFYWNSTLLQPFYFRFVYSIEVLLMLLSSVGLYYVSRKVRFLGIPWIALAALLWYHVDHTETKRQAAEWASRDTEFDNRWKEVAAVFRQMPDHDRVTIAWSDVGILPYFSDTRNIDLVGLNTNEIARARSIASVRRYLLTARPDFILVPLDHAVAPGDSCRTIVKWGHGFIGRIYPTLLHDPDFASYQPVSCFRHEAYDILILANDSIRGREPDLASRFSVLPYSLPIPTCFD